MTTVLAIVTSGLRAYLDETTRSPCRSLITCAFSDVADKVSRHDDAMQEANRP